LDKNISHQAVRASDGKKTMLQEKKTNYTRHVFKHRINRLVDTFLFHRKEKNRVPNGNDV
jgi:hypothetical protein